MNVYIFKNETEIAKLVAKEIVSQVKKKPNSVLGLATGNTMLPLYKELVEDYNLNGTNYEQVKTFNLDEYVGLAKQNKDSYYFYMQKNLFHFINVKEKNIHLPSGTAKNLKEECDHYNRLLKEHTIDIQLLGIGTNGHIGFNEPSNQFTPLTHIVELKESTIVSNSKLFNQIEDMPKKALTMGTENILNANKIILIATGKTKQKAVQMLLEGAITPMCPASILQKHNNVDVYLDEESAYLLKQNRLKKTA